MSIHREDILGCACDLLLKEGRDGFSMRRLARAVGVTAPALYRYYEGREDVLQSVLGEAYKMFYQYLYGALSGASPAERLRMAGEAYLEFALDHPRYYEMIHAPLDVIGLDELPEEIASRACAVGQFWHDRLRECIDTGFIRAEDPQEIGMTMWAHSHGLISLYLRGLMGSVDGETFRKMYRASCDRALRGIATEEGARNVSAHGGGPAADGGDGPGGIDRRDESAAGTEQASTGNGGDPI